MRYLHRTHRVSVSRLHEAYQRKDFDLVYELTTRMCADIYTKAFVDSGKWEAACELINIVDPKWLQRVISERAALEKENLQNQKEGGADEERQSSGSNTRQPVAVSDSSASSRQPVAAYSSPKTARAGNYNNAQTPTTPCSRTRGVPANLHGTKTARNVARSPEWATSQEQERPRLGYHTIFAGAPGTEQPIQRQNPDGAVKLMNESLTTLR